MFRKKTWADGNVPKKNHGGDGNVPKKKKTTTRKIHDDCSRNIRRFVGK